ncbi:hypothetical protein PVAP13_9NG370900 [Panicum virgatum]|uniref:DNA (cytosine-5-)-methyltransferase n=1 Tax=Panicum virgatum TaxID=38727 RepID=A0A8T0MS08_PANVG|nr:hypothetical protein PVAP13_9NG370900 [Panicum virgatum]
MPRWRPPPSAAAGRPPGRSPSRPSRPRRGGRRRRRPRGRSPWRTTCARRSRTRRRWPWARLRLRRRRRRRRRPRSRRRPRGRRGRRGWRSPGRGAPSRLGTTSRSSLASPSPPPRRVPSGPSVTTTAPPPIGTPPSLHCFVFSFGLNSFDDPLLLIRHSCSPDEDEEVKARCHYRSAKVDNVVYSLDDDVYVKAGENEADYIGRITEFFAGTDGCQYFTCRWFFRPEDTIINSLVSIDVDGQKHDPRRVFLSEEKNDNVLDCIISKVKIVHVDPNMDPKAKAQLIEHCDLYYDMSYSVAYSTFANIPSENGASGSETASGISDDADLEMSPRTPGGTATLLDLYSGCGGMSTGLCLGAALAGLKLETRWAVDLNSFACQSLKYNHPQTEVRNEKADEFLALLREWAVLCDKYVNKDVGLDLAVSEDPEDDDSSLDKDEFVVEKLIGICYGGNGRENGIYFKVQWEGYGPEEDTWEPINNLSDCPLKIKEFVQEGYRRKILPLPGDVDVICGGPPCQGISGFNRFRNRNEPLKDEKNKQMVTFMDIVAYLKPKYVLMENVVDILKFADGYLGRYALSCLVALNYQARLGMMVAGCYGLPQFRMRVFLWGALSSMVLPKYPLPTHDVVVRGGAPNAFSQSIVAYDETQRPSLKKALLLGDAISDLPEVENYQPHDVMEYSSSPKTEFQCYIRLSRKDMLDWSFGEETGPDEGKLLDHQPLRLNDDDYARVQQIPVKKGANFRDLKGVRVGANNIVEWDPEIERVYLSSGKPLVPDYAMSFIKGRSLK